MPVTYRFVKKKKWKKIAREKGERAESRTRLFRAPSGAPRLIETRVFVNAAILRNFVQIVISCRQSGCAPQSCYCSAAAAATVARVQRSPARSRADLSFSFRPRGDRHSQIKPIITYPACPTSSQTLSALPRRSCRAEFYLQTRPVLRRKYPPGLGACVSTRAIVLHVRV